MNEFFKKLRNVLIGIFLIILGLGIIFQIRAEIYLVKVKKDYGIFDTKRRSYIPFFIFEIQYKISGCYEEYFKYAHLPYNLKGYKDGYFFHVNYGRYFTYCFYSLNDLQKISKDFKKKP